MKFTVIILMYNSPLQSVLLTIKSVLQQYFSNFEIILADDGSQISWKKEIEEYMSMCNFREFIFSPSSENLGTVKNILRALDFANGKYIKCIGAGDLLYDKDVLNYVYQSMEKNNAFWSFGNVSGYSIKQSVIYNTLFIAPLDKRPYIKKDNLKIKEKIVVLEDYISGASMFFEKNYMKKYLNKIKDHVKYAEDIMQVLIILDNTRVLYLPRNLIIYEVGTGISTGKKKNVKLKEDHDRFNDFLFENYSDKFVLKRKRRVQVIKNWNFLNKHAYLLLKSPKHVFLQKYRDWNKKMPKRNLGFLDESDFYGEFQLSRKD